MFSNAWHAKPKPARTQAGRQVAKQFRSRRSLRARAAPQQASNPLWDVEEPPGSPAAQIKGRRKTKRAAEDESDVRYQGILTNADIEADPPGHKSGYVAIIGRPNAGKSTLLNALVGQKLSIVSPKAQTTRHRILGIVSEEQSQMVLLDTPGVIDEQRNRLEGRMMSFVKSAMREADAIVAIVDLQRSAREVLAMIQPPAGYSGPPILVVLNKADMSTAEEIREAVEWWKANCRCEEVLVTSAIKGKGVVAVKAWMVAQLPEGPTLYPKKLVSEHPERFFVSEIVREHVFQKYEQEVPYCVQVNVLEFKERARAKDYVKCELVCEHKSQKGILLGAGGSAIKALATAARLDIEEFLGRSVYLDMYVRADDGWRSDAAKLKTFGY